MALEAVHAEVSSVAQMEAAGERLGKLLHPGDVIILDGPLGAGKTTLTRGIARGVGVTEGIQSPTFVIARSYPIASSTFHHVDAYRLTDVVELDDLDLDFDASIAVIEWGMPFVEALTDAWLTVQLDIIGTDPVVDGDDVPDIARAITATAHGQSWQTRLESVQKAFAS